MATTCNIDRKGRMARLTCGLLILGVAVVPLVFAIRGGPWWHWAIAGVLGLAGGFQIYEAAAGWCATRALGIRTPM